MIENRNFKLLIQYKSVPPLIDSFSGPQNRETNGGNETISGGLKQLEEIVIFFKLFQFQL